LGLWGANSSAPQTGSSRKPIKGSKHQQGITAPETSTESSPPSADAQEGEAESSPPSAPENGPSRGSQSGSNGLIEWHSDSSESQTGNDQLGAAPESSTESTLPSADAQDAELESIRPSAPDAPSPSSQSGSNGLIEWNSDSSESQTGYDQQGITDTSTESSPPDAELKSSPPDAELESSPPSAPRDVAPSPSAQSSNGLIEWDANNSAPQTGSSTDLSVAPSPAAQSGPEGPYFDQAEIKGLLERALAQEAIAISPGIFVVFRDKLAEQAFLANRHRRAHDISHLLSLLDHSPRDKRDKDALLLEEHSGLIKPIWAETLRLGRLPDSGELDPDTSEKVTNRLGSIREAVRLAQTAFGVDALKEARASRIDDLKVYFSLNLFNRRKPYRVLPVELQRDVKGFFGSYKNADFAGRELLFSVGDPSTIAKACEQASKNRLGFLDGDHSLQLDASLVERLPAPLRVYTGCGEVLYGDIDDADLVKIHLQSGKLTLLKYEDYDTSPLPTLKQRIKIRLRDQDVEFFDYGGEYSSQYLYMERGI
jgi:hypothetical protein